MEGEDDIGNIKHELVRWRHPSYFRGRVRNGAAGALVTAVVGFGETTITVSRSLQDLSVQSLSIDGSALLPSEERYREAVLSASGVDSFFDFYLLLRYLVFFLEDRRPIVWDRTAQDEAFRLLFYPAREAKRAGELMDVIQSLDSEVRNMRVFVNRRQTQLTNLERQHSIGTQIRSRLSSSAVKLQAQVARLEEVDNAIERCNAERIGTRQKLEREKLLLEETTRDHQRERQRYFAQLFPKISEVANYVLVTLDSGAGCLVCGNKEPDAARRVHALTAEGICPVCEAPP
jgi:hypothetical protein